MVLLRCWAGSEWAFEDSHNLSLHCGICEIHSLLKFDKGIAFKNWRNTGNYLAPVSILIYLRLSFTCIWKIRKQLFCCKAFIHPDIFFWIGFYIKLFRFIYFYIYFKINFNGNIFVNWYFLFSKCKCLYCKERFMIYVLSLKFYHCLIIKEGMKN